MERNTKIEEMIRTAEAWRAGRDAREAEALKPYAADSEERYEAGIEFNHREELEHPYPFTAGENTLMKAYERSMEDGADLLEFADSWWDYDIRSLVEAMKETGVRGFAITEESTALMRDLWSLQEEGCSIGGMRMVTREHSRWHGKEEKKGILIHVN